MKNKFIQIIVNLFAFPFGFYTSNPKLFWTYLFAPILVTDLICVVTLFAFYALGAIPSLLLYFLSNLIWFGWILYLIFIHSGEESKSNSKLFEYILAPILFLGVIYLGSLNSEFISDKILKTRIVQVPNKDIIDYVFTTEIWKDREDSSKFYSAKEKIIYTIYSVKMLQSDEIDLTRLNCDGKLTQEACTFQSNLILLTKGSLIYSNFGKTLRE
ncbi:MAG: hypothetical protein SFU98_19145 [Leptospiraceae bacterium]|nr:hypothetical protein [Leptospiraceae bacterium]